MRRRVKSLLGWLALASGLYRLFFRDKAVIVLFHRVDDALEHDPISCDRRTFAAYCDLFRRYFRVVSLEDLVARLRGGEDIGRRLVITFDDGYRDNLEVAAVELKQRQLPACFFLATGYIGTEHVAPWDRQNGIQSRWMSWHEVRRMREQGFELGAHTVSHCDLALMDPIHAAREITGSRERLEQELGEPVRLFSYPFGGRDNMTSENRAEVRKAGFVCCVSAFGGVVSQQSDPFYLERIPVSTWHISPYQFVFEVMLEPARKAPVPVTHRSAAVPN
jgi:peptidoglycan/xylan/chitin deacetylase (PgdA/CDA1 family)